MKKCSKCGIEKEPSSFYKHKSRKDCLAPQCSSCMSEHSKKYVKENKELIKLRTSLWKKNNPEKVRAQQVKLTFGLEYDEYCGMYEKQGGCCAICKTSLLLFGTTQDTHKIANVDHDHITGNVRGLLCRACNTSIGLMKENVTAIRMAAEYLEKDSK